MSLRFPNRNRFYDATRRAVRFWGHDDALEMSFFMNEDALRQIQPDMPGDEAGFLRAFDSNRDLVQTVATKIYRRGHKGSYDLTSGHF